jgi:excisionase family DNA binding protein
MTMREILELKRQRALEDEREDAGRRFVLYELPLLLRIEQAAHELQLSRRRIYQLVHAGELELVKIGKAARITRASVLRLAHACEDTG